MLRAIEEILLNMCHDRLEPSEEECDESVDTDLLPPYIPVNGRGARVTMSSSISLLSKLVQNHQTFLRHKRQPEGECNYIWHA